ncbi:hypothetical protein KY290_004204 [Solanum tuberosum]|uniref:Uncharacterized protein n=1 Tax=Solanum tuberosum TaxID=4113 RepID=A0ABQ7WWG7_SOLTU|nr:hypothetical protein KY290_004204 [Solanum tuberosum]
MGTFEKLGLKQVVAFKPLTLRGLPESFIAALRDGRNHNWKKSLIGTIQTSLAYGPVVTRRPIKWEEIDFPQEWVIENATQPQNNINTEVPSRASTSQIRENYRYDNIEIDKDNIVKPVQKASSDLDITESEMNFPNGITG